jgi:uncharacterized protein (DUF2249 family)
MKITQHTKISKILKEKPEAIDIIAGINPNFKKLQNPILRRSLATRVSVKDAAKIGKIPVNEFLKALQQSGFEVVFTDETKQLENKQDLMPPDFSNREIITLDVRPIINEGKDPFGYINKVAKQIKPEQILLIINDFEPIPLIEYLIGKNFIHWMKQDKEGNYLTYFKLNCKKNGFWKRLFGKKDVPCRFHNIEKPQRKNRKARQAMGEKIEIPEQQEGDFEKIQNRYKGKMREIDVRDLEMPLPMQTILEQIEKLNEGEALFVHHKRIPQFLLPELKKRRFNYVAKELEPDYTYLIVYKN